MAKTKIDGTGKTPTKQKSRNPKIEFEKLQLYFGEPYVIDLEDCEGSITMYQPTIGDIIHMGENKFYSTINIFVTNTTSYRLPLWEANVDWNEISDFELFIMLYKGIDKDVSKLIFGDLDWDKFEIGKKGEDENTCLILFDEEDNIEINEMVYFHISQYLRNVFNIFPEEKITTDATMKRWFINKDKRQMAIESEKGNKESSSIIDIVSACVNHPGFKYNLEQLKEIGVCQFYDSVKRLQVYESSTALMKGMYSGFIDSKHIKPDDYNFMREI